MRPCSLGRGRGDQGSLGQQAGGRVVLNTGSWGSTEYWETRRRSRTGSSGSGVPGTCNPLWRYVRLGPLAGDFASTQVPIRGSKRTSLLVAHWCWAERYGALSSGLSAFLGRHGASCPQISTPAPVIPWGGGAGADWLGRVGYATVLPSMRPCRLQV